LSPALLVLRDAEFCQQEWEDVISGIDMAKVSPGWASLLVTGNMAIRDPDNAYDTIKGLGSLDNGLGRAWAMYWAAVLAAQRQVLV